MRKDINEVFCHNLRDYLYMAGMTQVELAKKVGVTETSVSKWMNGTVIPRPKKVDEICHVLKCSRADLMTDHEQKAVFAPEDILASEMKDRKDLYSTVNALLRMSDKDLKMISDLINRMSL